MTGLRAIAAYTVLFAHILSWTLARADVSIQPLAERIAYFGISLFFVLSGFVIQYNYGETIAFGGWRGAYNFFVARFARLYPLYAATLATGFYLGGGIPYLDRPDIVLSHLTLTQSWIGSLRAYFPVTWTISTEWFFYLLFIPLCRIFLAVRHPGRALVAFVMAAPVVLGIAFYFVGYIIRALGHFTPVLLDRGELSINPLDWLEYYGPLIRALEFCVGCLCARVYQRGTIRVPGLAVAAAIGWCILVIACGNRMGPSVTPLLPNFIFAPALAVIILAACKPGPLGSILGARPIVFGGEISYSVYLLQSWIVEVAFGWFETNVSTNPILASLAAMAAVTVFATISWLSIELPCRWLLRRLSVTPAPARFLAGADDRAAPGISRP
ncbi:MAG: acyltransferase [Alphaproteobacteria bacterium]|nr:acyltransferase [Alphaproteobacteria bacterium]